MAPISGDVPFPPASLLVSLKGLPCVCLFRLHPYLLMVHKFQFYSTLAIFFFLQCPYCGLERDDLTVLQDCYSHIQTRVSLHLTNVLKCLRIPFKSQGFYVARLGSTLPDKARTGSDSWVSAWLE